MRAELAAPELARVAHSMKARFRAAVARTQAERRAVRWDLVDADINEGVTEDFLANFNFYEGWELAVLSYGTYRTWSDMTYLWRNPHSAEERATGGHPGERRPINPRRCGSGLNRPH